MERQEVTRTPTAIKTVRDLLERSTHQFALALPKHIRADQFIRVAMTTIQKNPALLQCTQVSLLACLMEAAQLGLQVDGLLGEAHLVPYRNKAGKKECQLIPGYKGLLKLARNSGEISTVHPEVVYTKDFLEVEDGLDPKLIHRRSEEAPVEENEPLGPAVRAAYCVARMKDGGVSFCLMWRWEIDRIRAQSKAKDSDPWITHYPEMAKKTVIRRHSKILPASAELVSMARLEDLAEAGLPQNLGNGAIDITDAIQEPYPGSPEGSGGPTEGKAVGTGIPVATGGVKAESPPAMRKRAVLTDKDRQTAGVSAPSQLDEGSQPDPPENTEQDKDLPF
jgi:recombination protein RecT